MFLHGKDLSHLGEWLAQGYMASGDGVLYALHKFTSGKIIRCALSPNYLFKPFLDEHPQALGDSGLLSSTSPQAIDWRNDTLNYLAHILASAPNPSDSSSDEVVTIRKAVSLLGSKATDPVVLRAALDLGLLDVVRELTFENKCMELARCCHQDQDKYKLVMAKTMTNRASFEPKTFGHWVGPWMTECLKQLDHHGVLVVLSALERLKPKHSRDGNSVLSDEADEAAAKALSSYDDILESFDSVIPTFLPEVLRLDEKARELLAHHNVFTTIVENTLAKDGCLLLIFFDGVSLISLLAIFSALSIRMHHGDDLPLDLLALAFACNAYSVVRIALQIHVMSQLGMLGSWSKNIWRWVRGMMMTMISDLSRLYSLPCLLFRLTCSQPCWWLESVS